MVKGTTDVRPTVCFWCKAECGLLATVKNGRLVGLEEIRIGPSSATRPPKDVCAAKRRRNMCITPSGSIFR